MGTFEEAARPGFEPVWWVEPERSEVELLIEAVLEVVLEADVAEPQRDDA